MTDPGSHVPGVGPSATTPKSEAAVMAGSLWDRGRSDSISLLGLGLGLNSDHLVTSKSMPQDLQPSPVPIWKRFWSPKSLLEPVPFDTPA